MLVQQPQSATVPGGRFGISASISSATRWYSASPSPCLDGK